MKLYAVAINAQSVTQVHTIARVVGGRSFEEAYKLAHDAAKREFPTHSYTSHWVGFCEVPEHIILQAAELIKKQKENK